MRRTYAVVMILASVVALLSVVVANATYTRHVQQQSDRHFAAQQAKAAAEVAATNQRWCALFTTLDSPQAPPTNERGRVIQDKIRDLKLQLKCEKP